MSFLNPTSRCYIVMCALFFSFNAFASDYFWVGGTGKWSEYSTHWATATNGSNFHNSVPSKHDNVYFDANSFTQDGQYLVVDGDTAYACLVSIASMNHQVTFYSTGDPVVWAIYGDFYINDRTNVDMSFNKTWRFVSFGLNYIDFDDAPLNGKFEFDGGGGYILKSNLLASNNSPIDMLDCDLDFKGHTVHSQSFNSVSNNDNNINISDGLLETGWLELDSITNLIADHSKVLIYGPGCKLDHKSLDVIEATRDGFNFGDTGPIGFNTVNELIYTSNSTTGSNLYLNGDTIYNVTFKGDADLADNSIFNIYNNDDGAYIRNLRLEKAGANHEFIFHKGIKIDNLWSDGDVEIDYFTTASKIDRVIMNANLETRQMTLETLEFNGDVLSLYPNAVLTIEDQFTVSSTINRSVTLQSKISGATASLQTNFNLCLDYLEISDISGLGQVTYNMGEHSTDVSNNLNLNFSSCAVSAINPDASLAKVKLYPNPTDGIVTVTNLDGIQRITIYNYVGKLILRTSDFSTHFEHNFEESGIFFIELKGGQATEVQKVIVE